MQFELRIQKKQSLNHISYFLSNADWDKWYNDGVFRFPYTAINLHQKKKQINSIEGSGRPADTPHVAYSTRSLCRVQQALATSKQVALNSAAITSLCLCATVRPAQSLWNATRYTYATQRVNDCNSVSVISEGAAYHWKNMATVRIILFCSSILGLHQKIS